MRVRFVYIHVQCLMVGGRLKVSRDIRCKDEGRTLLPLITV